MTIHVWDIGPGHPSHSAAGDDALNGRGLGIIDELTAHEWGWQSTPRSGGKLVWASLATSPPRPGSLPPDPRAAKRTRTRKPPRPRHSQATQRGNQRGFPVAASP
jgi:hypothetical protein